MTRKKEASPESAPPLTHSEILTYTEMGISDDEQREGVRRAYEIVRAHISDPDTDRVTVTRDVPGTRVMEEVVYQFSHLYRREAVPPLDTDLRQASGLVSRYFTGISLERLRALRHRAAMGIGALPHNDDEYFERLNRLVHLRETYTAPEPRTDSFFGIRHISGTTTEIYTYGIRLAELSYPSISYPSLGNSLILQGRQFGAMARIRFTSPLL